MESPKSLRKWKKYYQICVTLHVHLIWSSIGCCWTPVEVNYGHESALYKSKTTSWKTGILSYGVSMLILHGISLQIPLNEEKILNNICYMQFNQRIYWKNIPLDKTISRLFYWNAWNKPKGILPKVEAWKNLTENPHISCSPRNMTCITFWYMSYGS